MNRSNVKIAAILTGTILLAAFPIYLVCKTLIGSGSSGARTTPATESIQGQYITGAELVDAGNTTPEAALESTFWASANGNYDVIIASYVPQMRKKVKGWLGDKTQFATYARIRFMPFKGLQILARKTVAADQVELRYHIDHINSWNHFRQPTTNNFDQILLLVKMGGAWKLSDQTRYETNWDKGSQPEPQP
jgi:hypothetical protein